MAPAASTTDVCADRPAHPALSVRHVHVTPAADTREPGRWHQPQPRAAAKRGAGRAINTVRQCRAMGGRTAPRGARTHSSFTHAAHARAHRQTKRHAQTHAHTHAHRHTRGRARPHKSTRTQFLPRDMQAIHVIASAAAFTCPAMEESGTGEGLKCVRRWVGLVQTPWVSLDYPSSTPPVVPPRVPPGHPL
jgi:hypothetical protein